MKCYLSHFMIGRLRQPLNDVSNNNSTSDAFNPSSMQPPMDYLKSFVINTTRHSLSLPVLDQESQQPPQQQPQQPQQQQPPQPTRNNPLLGISSTLPHPRSPIEIAQSNPPRSSQMAQSNLPRSSQNLRCVHRSISISHTRIHNLLPSLSHTPSSALYVKIIKNKQKNLTLHLVYNDLIHTPCYTIAPLLSTPPPSVEIVQLVWWQGCYSHTLNTIPHTTLSSSYSPLLSQRSSSVEIVQLVWWQG